MVGSRVAFVSRRDFKLPGISLRSGDDEWKRGFGELNENAAIFFRCYHYFPRNLRRIFFRPPDRLPLLHRPAGFRKIRWRQRRQTSTTRLENNQKEDRGKETSVSPSSFNLVNTQL